MELMIPVFEFLNCRWVLVRWDARPLTLADIMRITAQKLWSEFAAELEADLAA